MLEYNTSSFTMNVAKMSEEKIFAQIKSDCLMSYRDIENVLNRLYTKANGYSDMLSSVTKMELAIIDADMELYFKGIRNCDGMFSFCVFPSDFRFDEFDTSKVTSMMDMFSHATFNEGFSLGNNFDTTNVSLMRGMFMNAKLNSGFTLGDKFDTFNVDDMQCMFYGVEFKNPYVLGDLFNTGNVEIAYNMFCNAKFCKGFTLGKHFKLTKDTEIGSLFGATEFNDDFRFEDGCYVDFSIAEAESALYPALVYPINSKTKLPKRVQELLQRDLPIEKQVVTILYYLGSVHNMEDALQEFKKTLGKGATLSGAYYQLSESNCCRNVREAYQVIRNEYLKGLIPAISKYLRPSGGSSAGTVGECREAMLKEVYPIDLICECIVDYLAEQYVIE